MSLSHAVRKFIEKEELFLASDVLLCAVSGGKDSMVMLDILNKLKYRIEVAHINYMLRGQDSIKDLELVKQYCGDNDIVLHTKVLDEQEVHHLNKGNLQEKARDIRYAWFNEIIESTSTQWICIAHHKNDVAETFLLNALRGAGVNGLRSIQSKIGLIRRPLMDTDDKDIRLYVKENNLPYRDDQSNLSDKYDRNFIRINTIKKLQERWPSAVNKLAHASSNVSREFDLLTHLITQESEKWISKDKLEIKLGPLSELKKIPQYEILIYHLLKDYGFNFDVIHQMISDHHEHGGMFRGESHTASIHHNYLLIQQDNRIKQEEVPINSIGEVELTIGQLSLSIVHAVHQHKSSFVEYISLEESRWPLIIRTWKEGDKIKPLGMNGKEKKLSDILIDQKASYFEKQNQLVLIDKNGEIIWVIGRKLSETVRYDINTTEYLKLELVSST